MTTVTNGQLQKQLTALQKAVNKLTGSLKNHVAHVEVMLQNAVEGRVVRREKDVKKTKKGKGRKSSKSSYDVEWYQCKDCVATRRTDLKNGIEIRVFKGKNAKANCALHKKFNPDHKTGIYRP